MKKIGITGGIGSGKTTVCQIFKTLGIAVFNSDIESKNIINSNYKLKLKLTKHFGNHIYKPDGSIDKVIFGEKIFGSEKNLLLANSIIHPAVKNRFNQWCEANSESEYVIKEAAILFESGAYHQLDSIISVSASENIRIKRLILRDNSTIDEIKMRITKQWTQQKKDELADYIIYNNGTELLIPQITKIHNNLIKR